MLDFSLSAENIAWKEKIKLFVREDIVKHPHLDNHGSFPRELYQKAFELGIITCMIPTEYGGQGKTLLESALAAEECAYGDLGFTTSAFLMRLSIAPLLYYGTEEQKQKWIKPLTESLKFASFCFTEPEGSTNLGSRPASTIAIETEDAYIINGTKWTISNASVASLYLVFARIEGENSGLTCFVIPREAEGLSVSAPYKKMGQRAADTAEVKFENVKIPKDNKIGRQGEGAQIALTSLRHSRVGIGAMALGVAQRARDLAKKHCHERLNGEGKPIIYEQDIKFRFAEIEAKIEMLRSFVYRGIWEMDNGKKATFFSSSVKLLGAQIANEVVQECLDLHGGKGYLEESLIEKLVRDTMLLRIYEGTEAVQKLLIADSAIRLPRELRS